jgi:hypothetical protein
MSFRRRHRWTRRFLVGLAFGLIVAPAQARPLPAGPGHDDSAVAASVQQATDPYLTDIPSRPATAVSGPDGTVVSTSSEVIVAVRPDDRAERFTVTGGVPAATADDGFAVDWENGVTIGLGALAIALALGFAVAYMRRPRIAL